MERVLFGSTTLSLVKHLTVPIISVPDNISECKLDQVALAVDSSGIQSQESVIARFLQLLPMRLHIVHINEKEADDTNLEKMLPQVNAVHRTMKAEEFATGIEIYVEQNNIDLLIVLPHKHNFLERLFFSQHTDELLQKIKIPMMCIPEQ
jgi:nucleotide-binding universal stress UspA family protein